MRAHRTRRSCFAALILALAVGSSVTSGCDSSELPDAALDARAPEGDAGMDGGADAGDAAMPDGGPRDAAMPDGGPRDAAPPLPDTGPPTCDDPDTHYRDLDGDGFGDPAATVESCDPVEGFVLVAGDCDDDCVACHEGAAEMCDGRDGDCDGAIDETETCVPGQTVDCTTSCGTAGTGACTDACGLPTGDACTLPAETCNGMDDNCDGSVDETFTCAQGETATCTTSCGTTGTGACTAMCGAAAPADCTPPAESCNGMDDNCDGSIDETFTCALGEAVTCMTSCGTTGTGTCTASCGLPTGAACAPPAEVCNGVDDDCDGDRDETFVCAIGDTVACTTSCGTTGTGTCTGSCELPTGAACMPPSEVCNGMDDDCDGDVDEGFSCAVGDSVSCTTSCGTTGTGTCTGMCERPTGGACRPPRETCNGRDDDCDGQRDETYACVRGSTVSCTTSCGSTGTGTCTSSCGLPSTCRPPSETCTYSDDDCDGYVDEGTRRVLPTVRSPSYHWELTRPQTVNRSGGGFWSIWRPDASGARDNILYQLDEDGGQVGFRTLLPGTSNYAFESNSNGGTELYAYVDSLGDIRLHRIAASPTTAAPYRWSQRIATNAVEVHLAVLNSTSYVYWRDTSNRIRRQKIHNLTGQLEGAVVSLGSSEQRIAVGHLSGRRHFLAYYIRASFSIFYEEYNLDSREVFGLIPTGRGRNVRDIDIVGDYDLRTPFARRGIWVTYALDGPDELRYHYRPPSGSPVDRRIASLRTADSDATFSSLDLDFYDQVAVLGVVRADGSGGRPRAYRLTRGRLGTPPTVRSFILPTSRGNYQGVSAVRVPDSARGPDRIFAQPSGHGGASYPLGC